ncbi:MAG: hypothetical protein M1826_005206 [Phylliscum demangeonii]|nr:MAG: hypothetical protein M1826_005206 [Phylliscum demangeonii]
MTKNKKRKADGLAQAPAHAHAHAHAHAPASGGKRARIFLDHDSVFRPAAAAAAAAHSAGRVDPTTGLRSAFPGLDDEGELFYGPASDGLEYLRMVRSEARGVPNVLVAPSQRRRSGEEEEEEDEDESGQGDDGRKDARGYYYDGAYTALPMPTEPVGDSGPAVVAVPNDNNNNNSDKDDAPYHCWHRSLLLRYRLLRANLSLAPPGAALAGLGAAHPIQLSGVSSDQWKRGRYCIASTDPSPFQVAAMEQHTVQQLITIVACRFLLRRRQIECRTARWIWLLLGKLREVGCLSTDEVGVVRLLGKKAAAMLDAMRELGRGGVGRSAWEEAGEEDVGEEDAGGEEDAVLGADEKPRDGGAPDGQTTTGVETKTAEAMAVVKQGGEGLEETRGERPQEVKAVAVEDGEVEEGEVEDGEVEAGQVDDRLSTTNDADPIPPIPPTRAAHHPAASSSDHAVEEEEEEEAESLAAAKAGLFAQLPSPPPTTTTTTEDLPSATVPPLFVPSANTAATLDMILTIVGERYGQRDLLPLRERWGG